ncbi:MAG: hypothetical protein C0518_07980 [Opitutus sp.]|nr:hypothetical protein [Opitutus sp.]
MAHQPLGASKAITPRRRLPAAAGSALLLFSAAVFPVHSTFAADAKEEPIGLHESARIASRERLIAEAADVAGLLKANPQHPDALRLRFRESKLRLLAVLLTDGSSPAAGHAIALANAVHRDRHQPIEDRYEVARLLASAERKERKFADRAAWIAEREQAARRLIQEFPDLPAAYDELLAVAAISDSQRALRLARELLEAPAARASKERAQEIVWRHTTVGRPLAEAIAEIPGGMALLKRASGKSVVFYTWNPDDDRSIALANALAQQLPPETLVMGVSLSPKADRAMAIASEGKLPGEQLYGGRGWDSPVVRRLGLTVPSLLYVVGRDGVVRDLSSASDRAAALKKLN